MEHANIQPSSEWNSNSQCSCPAAQDLSVYFNKKILNMVNYNFDPCLYWSKVWYFVLREEHRLRITENRVPRKK